MASSNQMTSETSPVPASGSPQGLEAAAVARRQDAKADEAARD